MSDPIKVVPVAVAGLGSTPFSEGPTTLFVWDTTQERVKARLNDHPDLQFLTFEVMIEGGAKAAPLVLNRNYIIDIAREVPVGQLMEEGNVAGKEDEEDGRIVSLAKARAKLN